MQVTMLMVTQIINILGMTVAQAISYRTEDPPVGDVGSGTFIIFNIYLSTQTK